VDPTIWVVAGATLLGPIFAVQAQKWLERLRERRSRKLFVFQALMTTRATRVSIEHVQALNSLDLVFYGDRVLGVPRRKKTEQGVLDAWREYLDHLNTPNDPNAFATWMVRGDELFVNLLGAIATDLKMKFDRVQLRRGAYVPVAHGRLEQDQEQIRRALVHLLGGHGAIRVVLTDSSQLTAPAIQPAVSGTPGPGAPSGSPGLGAPSASPAPGVPSGNGGPSA
jgi:hypothetical protein